ncbi:MAG: hypothetical protein Q7K16_04535 [Candidatus Azambacteria bacterium]|nr:hypothetical protein [Candidatus Azambacteria bacterium]
METFIHKIKYHCAAIIIALILGVLMILPFFYFHIKLGNNFKGIFPEIVNDENFYYARIKDIVDGHSFLSNAYLAEHKEGLPQQLFLAEWFLAQLLKLFGLGINAAHLIYNFILPIVGFLLAYIAFYLILRKRFFSLGFCLFLFFGLFLTAFIRPVSPQFNFIFWLTQFIFLWLFIMEQRRKWIWLLAINFGLLFYVYPYYWTFYLIFFCVLAVLYFWKGRALSYGILAIASGGLVLAIPYFYLNYLAAQLPYYTETLTRLGMLYTRFPSGFRIILWSAFGLAIFSWFLWRRVVEFDVKASFFILGILSSVIVANQHLLTGKNFEFSSHYDIGAVFFLVFAVAYLFNTVKSRKLSIAIVIIIAAVVVNGLYNYSKTVFAVINENAIYKQNYAPIFKWLNGNTEKDSIVYANPDLSRLIPVYTANNVFYVREANLFFISDEEVSDRFILNNFFENFNKNFIIENDRSVYGVRYIDAYGHAVQGNKLRRLLGLKLEPEIYLPEEAILKVMTRAKELQKGNFSEELKKFRIDYLVWDKNKNPDWEINSKNFKPIFKNDNLIIFKFTP